MTTPEINNESKLNIVKNRYELSWFLADKWFRILEFSLILATLHYFTQVISNISLMIVYWLSWVLFWGWFEDISKLIVEIIYSKKRLSINKKAFVWLLCTTFVMIIYLLVTSVADSIISSQHLTF